MAVLLTVNTTAPPASFVRLTFHRVIADEIHQYFIPYYHSQSIWGVTATPFEKLSSIFDKFGQQTRGLQLSHKWSMLSYAHATQETFHSFVEAMNVFMIRHTKNQKIEGQENLKLPPMPKTSINVAMTTNERIIYNQKRKKIKFASVPRALTAVGIDTNLDQIRNCTLSSNKLIALQKDYELLLVKDPSANIVIFSRFTASINTLSKFIQRAFGSRVTGYWLRSSTTPKKRHAAIRNFQDPNNTKPKVLAINYKTGQCGITLTAASRIYLLEPCILRKFLQEVCVYQQIIFFLIRYHFFLLLLFNSFRRSASRRPYFSSWTNKRD